MVKPGDVITGVLLLGVGYAGYKLYTGEWQIPTIGGMIGGAIHQVIPTSITAPPSFKEQPTAKIESLVTKLEEAPPLDPFGLSVAIKSRLKQELKERGRIQKPKVVKRPKSVQTRLMKKIAGARSTAERIAYMKALTRGGFN